MSRQILIVGVGGQGVLLATRLLGEAAMARGLAVIGSETHGMSQRGGSVASHLRLGEFGGPMVRQGEADLLLGLNRDETLRNLAGVRPGGVVCANVRAAETVPGPVLAALAAGGIAFDRFDATAAALELGMPKLANLVLIGAALQLARLPFTTAEVLEVLPRAVPPRFVEVNRAAIEAGAQLAGRPPAGP